MSLNRCAHCTTLFSIGAEHCPQCGNADYYEEGSMPKISRHGGPSNKALTDFPTVEEAQATFTTGGTEVVFEAEPVEDDGPDDAPDGPYAGMLRNDLQDLLATRGLPTSGNKPELIARLTADDAAKAEQDSEPE